MERILNLLKLFRCVICEKFFWKVEILYCLYFLCKKCLKEKIKEKENCKGNSEIIVRCLLCLYIIIFDKLDGIKNDWDNFVFV